MSIFDLLIAVWFGEEFLYDFIRTKDVTCKLSKKFQISKSKYPSFKDFTKLIKKIPLKLYISPEYDDQYLRFYIRIVLKSSTILIR